VAELREVDALYQRYGDREDIVFFAVGTEDEREAAARFTTESPYSLPWGWDPASEAFNTLEAKTVPSLYLIDRQGRIRLTHVGYSVDEGLERHIAQQIDQLLAEPVPAGPAG
jgi:hypothetical protein